MNNGNKKTILLVEDEVIIAMMGKMELEKYGYCVHHVTTGENAIQTIIDNTHPVDLILMDIDLGSGIDGTQAAEQILSHKDIPVVFLSSHTEPEVVEKTEKITSYGYVVKNSGIVVLDASIKMAFKLFDAKIANNQKKKDLIKSEYKYRMLFENMNISFAVHEAIYDDNGNPADYRYLDMNPMFVNNLGCTAQEICGHTAKELFPNTEQYWIDTFGAVAKTGKSVAFENYSNELNQWFNTFVFSPQKNQFASFFIDITKQKQMEEQRQAEEDNLRITLNSIGDAVISTDNQGRVVRMNPVAEMLCGWQEAEASGKKLEEVFYIVNADTRERVDTPVESVMSTGTVVGLANHTMLLSKNGKEYQIADSAAPITTSEGEITGVVLVFRDVTTQYEKDRQLEDRLKELNCLFKIAEIVEKPDIVLKDILQETAEAIPQSCQYPVICEAGITLHGQTFHTTNFTRTKWCLSSDLIVHGIVSGEVTVCYREEKPSRDEGPFLKEERKLLDAVAERLGRITERKQLEENLHSIKWLLSGEKDKKKRYMPEYGDLTELNNNGLILSSLGKDQLMQISSEYLDLLETSSAVYEKNGDYALGLFSSGWCQLLDAASRRLCGTDNNKEALSCSKWLCHESCWRDASLKSIESGRPVDVECAGGLRLYAIPVRANGEVIGAINFGYGNPPEDDIKLQKLSDLYQIPLEVLRKKREEYQSRPQFIIDYAKKRIRISAKLIGNLIERNQAEEEIKKQHSEKETLLREVHHRMKNNIANIESLLSLQVGSNFNSEVKTALQDALSRVKSMRVLYDKLLVSKEFREISMKNYTEDLIESIHDIFAGKENISIEKYISNFEINANKAVTVGIIINELLTNVFKYAFKGRNKGTVSITIEKAENTVTVIIHDNGIGIGERILENKSPGFGMTIVKMLVEQLNGNYRIVNENGTKSVLQFEI